MDEEVKNIYWCCPDCGRDYLREDQKNAVATFHLGTCDVCKQKKAVTHVRNYNYLYKKNEI